MFEYPRVSDADVVFGGYPKDWFSGILKKEFKSPENRRKYEGIVTQLFFKGGSIPCTTKDDERAKLGLKMFKAIIGSFEPKHEDKTKVCALILEDLNE